MAHQLPRAAAERRALLCSALDFLTTTGSQFLHDAGISGGSCIPATRVALDVLKSCGFDFVPVPARTIVYKQIATGERPLVGFGVHRFGANLTQGGYDGHLVAAGEGFVLDMTLDQVNKPHRRLGLRPTWFEVETPLPRVPVNLLLPPVRVEYTRTRDRTYREGVLWRGPHLRPLTKAITDELWAELGATEREAA